VLGRKCYLDRGFYTTRPNLYILLCGVTGSRKTSAIEIVQDVIELSGVDLNIIPTKLTGPEILINILQERFRATGTSDGYLINDEVSTFLPSGQDNGLLALLSGLYGCKENFDYTSFARGHEAIPKAFPCMLIGSVPEWLKSSMPKYAIEGGFFGRLVIVGGSRPEKKITYPTRDKDLRTILAADLLEISKISGEFSLSKDAREWFRNWYENVHESSGCPPELEGYFARKPETILKVSMVVAASCGDQVDITPEYLDTALKLLEQTEARAEGTFQAIQSSNEGEDRTFILSWIFRLWEKSHTMVHRSELMRKVGWRANSETLQLHLRTLEEMGLIETHIVSHGNRYTDTYCITRQYLTYIGREELTKYLQFSVPVSAPLKSRKSQSGQ